MNRDGINKTIFWSLLYIFLYSACTVIANLYLPKLLLITVGVSGIIYIIFNLFFIPYKREKLFVNGIFGALAVMFTGIWLGKQLDLWFHAYYLHLSNFICLDNTIINMPILYIKKEIPCLGTT